MDNYSSDKLFITIVNPQYRKKFIKTLDDMAFWVRVSPYMAVTPADSIFRKPFWSWLKKSAIDYYDSYQEHIFNELGLPTDTPPQTLAWYCTSIIAYSMLKNSPSCHYRNQSDQLSRWGEELQSFMSRLGDYAVENHIVSKNEASLLIGDLLGDVPGSVFYNSASAHPAAKTAPSPSTATAAPVQTESDYEKYKDFKLSPIEDEQAYSSPRWNHSKEKGRSYKSLIFAAVMLVLLIGGLALYSDPLPEVSSSTASSQAASSSSSYSSSKPSSKASVPASSKAPALIARSKPSTGLQRAYDNTQAAAPFEVEANDTDDFYLVLRKNGTAQRCYYIQHGETLSVHVPLGTYELYYACAPSYAAWYGTTDLWGSYTSFYKSSDSWDFALEDGYYTGYTLSLSVTYSGNTHSDETSEFVWDNLF